MENIYVENIKGDFEHCANVSVSLLANPRVLDILNNLHKKELALIKGRNDFLQGAIEIIESFIIVRK
jgi:hypothetical protein